MMTHKWVNSARIVIDQTKSSVLVSLIIFVISEGYARVIKDNEKIIKGNVLTINPNGMYRAICIGIQPNSSEKDSMSIVSVKLDVK